MPRELPRRVNMNLLLENHLDTLVRLHIQFPRAKIGVTLQHALVYRLAGNMQTYWGDRRAADCTPSRAWIDSGALVGAGTDSPVTGYDPWLNIYGFATRDTEVAGIIGPEHRISIAEALRAYTVGSAEILGMGSALGSLEVGKAADFICLERDPLASTPDQVRHMKVTRTFVGGRQVYPSPGGETRGAK